MTPPTIPEAVHLCPTCMDVTWGGSGRDCESCALHKAQCAAIVRVLARDRCDRVQRDRVGLVRGMAYGFAIMALAATALGLASMALQALLKVWG